jgi:hypothetical protein
MYVNQHCSITWIRPTLLTGITIALVLAACPAFTQQDNSGAEIRALPPMAGPPDDIADLEREIARKIPRPPGQTSVDALVDKISKRPGQAKKVDAARRGVKPENANPGKGKATSSMLDSVSSFFMSEADAAGSFSVNLTPVVWDSKLGTHGGLRMSDGSAWSWFLGAFVYWAYPNNDSVYLWRYNHASTGHQTINPMGYMGVKIPSDGWYTINMNAWTYGTVEIRNSTWLLDSIPVTQGWADYATLQYLRAGTHGFYFVLPTGGRVSRLSVDCFKC